MGKGKQKNQNRGENNVVGNSFPSPNSNDIAIGEGETNYNAIHVTSIDNDIEAQQDCILPTSSNLDLLAERSEMRDADVLESSAYSSTTEPMTKERRLTLLQLERFRKAVAKRKRRGTRMGGGGRNAKVEEEDDLEFDNLFGENGTSTGRELRFTSYPWAIWILATLIVIATTVFVDRVRNHGLGNDNSLKKDWWKYAVACVVYLLCLGLISSGRVEKFIMSKDTNRLEIHSTKPLCPIKKLRRERHIQHDFHSIVDIRVEASGEFSGDIDTRNYKVHFEFDDGRHATALETRSKKKAIRRCNLVKDFVLSGVPVAPMDASVKNVANDPKVPPVLVSIPSSSLPRKASTVLIDTPITLEEPMLKVSIDDSA